VQPLDPLSLVAPRVFIGSDLGRIVRLRRRADSRDRAGSHFRYRAGSHEAATTYFVRRQAHARGSAI
jgi:hypothetical protein